MTKSQIKYISALSRQKYRKAYKAYIVEGDKNVKEWLYSERELILLAAEADWLREHEDLWKAHPELELIETETFELSKISSLKHPQKVLMVAKMPDEKALSFSENSWSLYLEKLQDPGNMGTIIRTADWFGIDRILMSPDCVEIYNPKVVQATMGSLLRVDFFTLDNNILADAVASSGIPLYATCLKGDNIFELKNVIPGIIAMGNESAGLSSAVLNLAKEKITIPGIGSSESLNVGVATGIVCAHLVLG